jgi:hypothetical protein
MKTAQEIITALAFKWDDKGDTDTRHQRYLAHQEAQEEVTYAKVLARLGRNPEDAWREPEDPRLLAWLEVVETEVRVSIERLALLTDFRTKAIDVKAVQQATSEVHGVVSRLARYAPAPKPKAESEAEDEPAPVGAKNGSNAEPRPF